MALQEGLEAELAGRKEAVDTLTKELAELEEATGATQVGAGPMGRVPGWLTSCSHTSSLPGEQGCPGAAAALPNFAP